MFRRNKNFNLGFSAKVILNNLKKKDLARRKTAGVILSNVYTVIVSAAKKGCRSFFLDQLLFKVS